ncbi:hypothetical protein KZX45_16435 [Georgenia sp. EYE_87]|uniref:HAD domain-containing protein n=1 Tax=Georgenia sp. EYE_87 TaxID=2853448 RepID=UPI002003F1B4|nr:HAD domain-containing protein [Georgenia sp. EYE_87]MCK6212132.1 hypothetical protein [Georgenia sp. EYE_87]
MTTGSPLLLLDVDGTLCGYEPVEGGSVVQYGSFAMPYLPEVLATLTRLVEAGGEVVWLTTWPDAAVQRLGEDLGLPPFEVPPYRVEGPGSPAWWNGWKTRTALALVEERQPVRWAWCDDHMPSTVARRIRADHPEALLLAPDDRLGLTVRQMARVHDWLLPNR